jgi:transcriptional regulator with XRE-family HTH domain
MDDRRAELGRTERRLTWERVADRAGLSVALLRNIRAGTAPITKDSKIGIERALDWARGSVDAILAGGEPSPLDEPTRESGPVTLVGQRLLQLYDLLIADNYTHEEADAVIEAEIALIQRKRRNEQRDSPLRVTRTRAIG